MKTIVKRLEFLLITLLLAGSLFFDQPVLQMMRGLQYPYLIYLMHWITHLGSVFVVMVLMTSLFMWEEKKRKWVAVLWSSFLFTTVISLLMKLIVARPRPAEFGFPVVGSSFPSVHAAIAFSTVPVLDKEFPVFKWFWILFAISVGLSRVYFQYHYPSDVFAGALLGYVIGHFFVVEEKRLIQWFKRHL